MRKPVSLVSPLASSFFNSFLGGRDVFTGEDRALTQGLVPQADLGGFSGVMLGSTLGLCRPRVTRAGSAFHHSFNSRTPLGSIVSFHGRISIF